jgi:osmotically-inducible protein OsmY
MMRNWLLVLFSLSVLPMQGCAPLVIAGVGVTAYAVADRRSIGAQTDDETIEFKTSSRFKEQFGSAQYHVDVVSYNRHVLLIGEATSEDIKNRLTELARGVTNVASVTNEVQVTGNTSFSTQSNDALITSKVKSRFVTEGSNKFNANQVKVTTENGVVYLMGIVTQAEADAAVEVARTTSGVQRVVKVFEYIDKVPASEATATTAK